MSFPLHIAFRNMDPSESAEALVRARAADLQQVADRIQVCRVVLDCLHRQHTLGRAYRVHIDLTLPGGSILVNRDHDNGHTHDDVLAAIRDAFETARRKLQSLKSQRAHRERAERPGESAPASETG